MKERAGFTPGPLSSEEQEMAALLIRNGWPKEEAESEARRALADAAEEDGYDGP